MDAKKPWKSKTLLANAIVALASFFPPVSNWIGANPETFGLIISALNIGLRSVTGDPVSWKVVDRKL